MRLQIAKMIQKYKDEAFKSFAKKEYDLALKYYSLVLKYDSRDIDAKVGAVLSDFAFEDEQEAIALQDFYFSSITLGEDKEMMYRQVIESIDYEDEFFLSLFDTINSISDVVADGVEYQDFLKVAKQRGDIKRSLEDIMFSSKIIINSKEDMMDFIKLLFKYDFKDEAYFYLENAINVYPGDTYFEEKFRELSKRKYT